MRIKPSSILEALYPLSKHGPERCCICGLSFRDHLNTWWYTYLYTPYDLYLDQIQSSSRRIDEDNDTVDYFFYSNYIQEIPKTGNHHKHETRQSRYYPKGTNTRKEEDVELEGFEKRRVLNTRYVIPRIKVTEEMGLFRTFVLVFTRGLVLEELDEAIYLQTRENRRRRWRRERKRL